MKQLFLLPLLFIGLVACSSNTENESEASSDASQPQEYTTETIIEDIPLPWGMAWLPDGTMLVTNRDGELYSYSEGELAEETIDGVPEVWDNGQGGLLDIAVHPDYDQNGWIYITYSSPEGEGEGANTALMRAQFNDDRTSLVSQEVLYKGEPNYEAGQHFGSRIEFNQEGFLYFGIGDRGQRDVNPQDITRDAGKIYRLHDDGSIPEDNPFVGEEGAKEAIFSYGHRNPQGMDMHPETDQLWLHEHGPQGGDEVNISEAGNNYGWPVISYGINYDGSEFAEDTARAGMEQPEWYWDPSIAPSGMTFVTGDRYPDWQGDLLVGSLKFNYLVLCHVEDNTVTGDEIMLEDIGRVRAVEQGPDGYIYVATEGDGIQRIIPEEESGEDPGSSTEG